METMSSYSLDIRIAAVRLFNFLRVKKEEGCWEKLTPMEIIQQLAPGVTRSTIYRWVNEDKDSDDIKASLSRRGRHPILTKDQRELAIGYVIHRRSHLLHVSAKDVKLFIQNYLNTNARNQYIYNLLNEYGITHQRVQARSGRMITPEVVDDAIKFITELREKRYPSHCIIFMDETGIWSNTVPHKTYNVKNSYEIS